MLGLLAAMQILAGCGRQETFIPSSAGITEGRELFCLADSEEEASKVADQYQIELVSFSDGVAVFHTEDDPEKVIDYGISHNYTQLSLNTADTETK